MAAGFDLGFARFASVSTVALLAAMPALAQQAGAAGGVQGEVLLASAGLPSGAIGKQVKSGESIFIGDRIRSGAESGLQVMLLDETVFTIGADSDVTIDTFVYDPATGAGQLAATLGKGAFRFVTGKIAQTRPENMSVRTANATIGIRGTIVWGLSGETEDTIVLGGPGPQNNANERVGGMRVDPAGGGEGADVRREGYAAFARSGQSVEVRQLDQATRDRISGQLNAGQRRAQQQQPEQGGGTEGAAIQQADAQAAQDQSGQSTSNTSANAPDQQSFRAALEQGQQASDASTETQATLGLTTTYDNLRSVISGDAFYNSSGHAISGAATGTYSFSAHINFSSRQIFTEFFNINAGGESGINVTNGNASTSPNQNFSALAGNVSVTTNSSSCGGSTCVGTTTFQNTGGVVAGTANHSLTITNSVFTATGSGTATRSNTSPE
jgi:hypothetical protein